MEPVVLQPVRMASMSEQRVVSQTKIIGRIEFVAWTCAVCGSTQAARGPGAKGASEDARWGLTCEVCETASVLAVIPQFCTITARKPEVGNG